MLSKDKHFNSKIKLNEDEFYFENEKLIFTEIYHLRRGYCCGSGCRHCPFEPKHEKNNKKIKKIS